MCDYSLEHVASRPAKVGDKLETTRFWNTITKGFRDYNDAAGKIDPSCDKAICLLPGTELAFDAPIQKRPYFELQDRSVTLSSNVAVFTQVKVEVPYQHHDALQLPDGTICLLNDLAVGQTATVLQLGKIPEVSHVDLPAPTEQREPNAPVDAGTMTEDQLLVG